jgi:hypothetical protein
MEESMTQAAQPSVMIPRNIRRRTPWGRYLILCSAMAVVVPFCVAMAGCQSKGNPLALAIGAMVGGIVVGLASNDIFNQATCNFKTRFRNRFGCNWERVIIALICALLELLCIVGVAYFATLKPPITLLVTGGCGLLIALASVYADRQST